MLTDIDLVAAIDNGLQFLSYRQLPSGQFPVQVTEHEQGQIKVKQDEALFATALITYSLGHLDLAAAGPLIQKALQYFQNEMTGFGLWRHWNKSATRGSTRLFSFIPADLDDMSCISHLLERHGVPFPDNRSFMILNRNRSGLFYTWLMLRPIFTFNLRYWITVVSEFNLQRFSVFWKVTEAGYLDIDGVVNANVLLYLGDRAETRRVIEWLQDVVITGKAAECDKWYRDPYTFYYAVSRCRYAGITAFDTVRLQIVDDIERSVISDGSIHGNVLHTALAANVLMSFGEISDTLERLMEYTLTHQREDGSWANLPYYYGGPDKVTYWGSEELTTGICLEATARFRDAMRRKPVSD